MNTECILPIRPSEYLKQGPSHCGAFSVKGILSAYGKDDTAHPKEYHPHLFGRLTGLTTGLQYWPRVLARHGMEAIPKFAADLTDEGRLQLLRELLLKNNPVMVCIGNGYLPNGKYNPIRGRVLGHWITLWGYDDESELFYVYDSAVPKEKHDKHIPIGNTTRTYQEMLRDWKGALLSWGRGIGKYH